MTDPTDGFDRLRRRGAGVEEPQATAHVPDPDGKRALFSPSDLSQNPPAFGSVTIDCSSCRERTVVSARQAVSLAFPSLHLPLLRAAPWSWMRCPACRLRTWVEVHVQV